MLSYVTLLILVIILILGSYNIFNKDLLSPTFISCIIFGVCILLSIIGLGSWNTIKSINLTVILIIVCGLFSFLCGELFARKKVKGKKQVKIFDFLYKNNEEIKKLSKTKIICMLVFSITTTILLLFEVKKICHYYNFHSNSIPKLLSFYRKKTALFSTDMLNDGIDINFIIKQMMKICNIINIIIAYFLIDKLLNKNKTNRLETILMVITVVSCLFQTFFTSGGRSILMHFFVAYLMIFLLKLIKNNRKLSKKILYRCIIFTSSALVLFYLVLPLVGRKTNVGFKDYISFYLGAPIPSLNNFTEKYNFDLEKLETNKFGEESFSGLYYVLNKFDIIDYTKASSHEWISFDLGLSSNIYTSFRCYYHDFGFLGLIILQFLFGFFITIIYIYITKSSRNLGLIIYSFYAYIFIEQIRDEQFYSLINTSTIAMLILFALAYRFILCCKSKEMQENETKN